MDTSTVVTLLIGLILGLLIGLLAAWQVWRSRSDARLSEATADAARARTEVAQAQAQAADAQTQAADARTQAADARAEAADARAEAAQTRGELARVETTTARQETAVADARAEVAQAQAEAAEVASRLAAAGAERDAAIAQAKKLVADRETLVNQFKVLSTETLERQGKTVDATTTQRLQQTKEALEPLTKLMSDFADRLTQIEKERVAMSTDLRNQVRAVQSTGEHLRRETHALSTALRKPQVRGHWGEVQLKRVAEYAGMVDRCDFETQTTTQTTADRTIRPDMRVNLADGKYVFVDAKVPLSAFLDAHETEDDRTRIEKLTLFGRNVKTHVNQLSSKEYWKADAGTPEFVVLFLPNEQFLISAAEQVPDIHEYAATRNIVIATPNTLIALLKAVHYSWKQASLAESAKEVFELGRELHTRLASMGGHIDKTGRSLTAAMKAYNQMVGSLESRVLPTARRFRDLGVTEAELSAPEPLVESARPITAAELVEDAAQVEPMIGRPRRRELPEQAELTRSEPDLLDWVEAPAPSQRRQGA